MRYIRARIELSEMKQLTPPYVLELPYPLSINRYWRTNYVKKMTYVSERGLNFKKSVMANYGYLCKPVVGNIELEITIQPKLTKKGLPSKELIDLDNGCKCILDSLIGIAYVDDKQVKKITLKYGTAIEGGRTRVYVLWSI